MRFEAAEVWDSIGVGQGLLSWCNGYGCVVDDTGVRGCWSSHLLVQWVPKAARTQLLSHLLYHHEYDIFSSLTLSLRCGSVASSLKRRCSDHVTFLNTASVSDYGILWKVLFSKSC